MTRPSDIKRKRDKLRSEFYGHPWAMESASLSRIGQAIEAGDLESIQASLSFGGDEVETTMKVVNGVAVIPISGVLRDGVDYMVRWGGACSYQLLERDVASALGNDLVKSIVFYCNSPGGSAIGCKRVADMVFASRGKKPMVAYVQGQCCSACYYIAAAADRIEATADSMIGSIGTIMPHMEVKNFLDEIGYGVTVITNSDSPKKSHGNMYEKLTPEAKATLQSFIDSFGKPFIADVARYRGIDSASVVANFGQGDSKRADLAIDNQMIDAVVGGFSETLGRLSGSAPQQVTSPITSQIVIPVAASSASTIVTSEPVATGTLLTGKPKMKISAKVKAQLFACDLIESPDASDETCVAALKAWFRGAMPSDEAAILAGLRNQSTTEPKSEPAKTEAKPAENVAKAHESEQAEARLADLKASADLINQAAGYTAVSGDMVIAAFEAKQGPQAAMKTWNETLSKKEGGVASAKVTSEGRDRFGVDAIDALLYRAGNTSVQLSAGASSLVNRPLWAIAGECLALSGAQADMYGDRELLAENAMSMGDATRRQTFFSENENRQYISSSSSPFTRPGDFPNILSGLANKYLDMIELDDDYSYPEISAVLPGGLKDFKPAMMINKGVMEEMDELTDAEQIKDLGLDEEVLSYIFLRRFGNKFGWTPKMVADDDLGAFAEGMLGLAEAWERTQNRLVVERFTSNETLLDGSALFANRANTGTGSNPAANNNDVTSGGAPSDTTWAAMEVAYADIGGVNTGTRVRGTLNTCFTPTGARLQEARRTFMPLNAGGLEGKSADTTANVGLYRGQVRIIAESELRIASTTTWYALRNPTKLNTATVVRAYFNGYGTAGRRERWYDPTNKTTYVSLEGRMATAVKNWRYAVRNVA